MNLSGETKAYDRIEIKVTRAYVKNISKLMLSSHKVAY